MLGTTADKVSVGDMKVNPTTGNVYLSVSRGQGAGVAILRVDKSGKITELALTDVPFASAKLPNATKDEKRQADVITSMAFVDGKLYVAGLSNEEFASTLRSIAFPFKEEADKRAHSWYYIVRSKSEIDKMDVQNIFNLLSELEHKVGVE